MNPFSISYHDGSVIWLNAGQIESVKETRGQEQCLIKMSSGNEFHVHGNDIKVLSRILARGTLVGVGKTAP